MCMYVEVGYVLHADGGCVYVWCMQRVLGVCVCIGGCLERAGALGGGFGCLDKGLCLYLYTIPRNNDWFSALLKGT